jgi:hypothetical protein
LSDQTARNISRLADQRRWLALEQIAEIDRLQKEIGHFRRLGTLRLSSLEDWNSGKQLAEFAPSPGQNAKFSLLRRMIETGGPIRIVPSDPLSENQSQINGIIHEVGHQSLSVEDSKENDHYGTTMWRYYKD